ncbi:hypothetical protein PVK06_034888 [Gossypium arboreum]|uniref:Uncharacterized protein n=1 Tax=Gossypium arboreum TaxID=29729 RepID=A0ABR0NFF2_GOSAR|nr:hypothetical protein PVK06_034888 [Gossypium arboreum]
MLLCQQRGIIPHDGEKVLENNGPINEAFVERMTYGKDTLVLKRAETSKTRKGKTKAESKGTNLDAKTSLWHKMKYVEKMVSDNDKEEESKDIELCLQKIDSLFEDGIFDNQEDIVVEKEVAAVEEEVVAEEEVTENETEKEEEYSIVNIVTVPEYVGENIILWSEMERD